MSAKLSTLALLRIKNRYFIKDILSCDVIISVYDVTNKILSPGSNYIADVVKWTKFGNSTISMREVIITSILDGFDQKKQFFWGVVLVHVQ